MKKILIVDDDAHVSAFVKALFKLEGFDTIEASDGISAIEKLQVSQLDIVILDHDLPRRSGLDTLKEIKKMAPAVPVIMFTSSQDHTLNDEAIQAGASDFIRKPAEIEVMLAAVRRAIGLL